MSSSGSNSLRPQSPKWPTQLCSLHIVDFYGSVGQSVTAAAEKESQVQERFCAKPLLLEQVNMEGTFG